MTTYTLGRSQFIPGDPGLVFRFFESPRNLERITPPWCRFRIESSTDDPVRVGTRIAYRLRIGALPIRWVSVIAEYRPGDAFTDVMLRGPYRRWSHQHRFRAVEGGVEMTDHVEYEMPFGILGRLAHRLWVRNQLESIFDYRTAVISELFHPIDAPHLPTRARRNSQEKSRV